MKTCPITEQEDETTCMYPYLDTYDRTEPPTEATERGTNEERKK